MTKFIFINISIFLFYFSATAQIGINTTNPQGLVHIDAGTLGVTSYDVVVSANGNLGLGTTSPSTKLHIVTKGSTDVKGFRLADGSQGAGKILRSDANGVARWHARKIIFGDLGNTEHLIVNAQLSPMRLMGLTGYQVYTTSSITLEAGDYKIVHTSWFSAIKDLDMNNTTNFTQNRPVYIFFSTSSTSLIPLDQYVVGSAPSSKGVVYLNFANAIPVNHLFLTRTTGFNSDLYANGSILVRAYKPVTLYVWIWAAESFWTTTANKGFRIWTLNPGAFGPYGQLFATPVFYGK